MAGKSPLSPALLAETKPNTVILQRRPDLHVAISNIIYGIESGMGLPERHTKEDEVRLELASVAERMEAESNLSSAAKLKALNREAQRRGYSLSELTRPKSNELPEQPGRTSQRKRLPPMKVCCSQTPDCAWRSAPPRILPVL